MRCANPTLCYTTSSGRKFRSWNFAKHTKLTNHIVFNCGKCLFCRKKKSIELATRCVLHASLYTDNCFITLTYDESKDSYHNNLDYTDIQKFKKRLRKFVKNKKIEIFNVHEYGKNGKKHWHLVVFNYDFPDKEKHTTKNGHTIYKSNLLAKLWEFGFSCIGTVTEASAMYQAQYTQKDIKNGNSNNSKKSKSNHSGIARKYFELNYKQIYLNGYISNGGVKMPVPRYFEKLGHKHYCHFFDESAFHETMFRKRLYTSFSFNNPPRLSIALAYKYYIERKREKISEWEAEWDDIIMTQYTTGAIPDFEKAANNALYDLNNKNNSTKERF